MRTFLLWTAWKLKDTAISYLETKSSSKLYKIKDTTDTQRSAFIRKHCIDNKGFFYIRGDCNMRVLVFHMECNTDITCHNWESAMSKF